MLAGDGGGRGSSKTPVEGCSLHCPAGRRMRTLVAGARRSLLAGGALVLLPPASRQQVGRKPLNEMPLAVWGRLEFHYQRSHSARHSPQVAAGRTITPRADFLPAGRPTSHCRLQFITSRPRVAQESLAAPVGSEQAKATSGGRENRTNRGADGGHLRPKRPAPNSSPSSSSAKSTRRRSPSWLRATEIDSRRPGEQTGGWPAPVPPSA